MAKNIRYDIFIFAMPIYLAAKDKFYTKMDKTSCYYKQQSYGHNKWS